MTKLTPDQINRGLSLAESVLSLVTDVWSHRKASAKKVRGLNARKVKGLSK